MSAFHELRKTLCFQIRLDNKMGFQMVYLVVSEVVPSHKGTISLSNQNEYIGKHTLFTGQCSICLLEE